MRSLSAVRSLFCAFATLLFFNACAATSSSGDRDPGLATRGKLAKIDSAVQVVADKIEVLRSTAILGASQDPRALSTRSVEVDDRGRLRCRITTQSWSSDFENLLTQYDLEIAGRKKATGEVVAWIPYGQLAAIASLDSVIEIGPTGQ